MNKLLIFTLLCGAPFALAEEKLYQFPSGPATWTVTCSQTGKAAPTPTPQDSLNPNEIKLTILKRIEVAQTGDVRRSIMHWSNGKSRELWSLPKMNVLLTEDSGGRTFVSDNFLMFGDQFSPSDFYWIKSGMRTNEKPVQYDGVECNHYAGIMMVHAPIGATPAEPVPCQAWINAETQLPVALQKGDVLGRFSFGDPPSTALEMPEKFRKRLNYYKRVVGIR